MEVGGSDAVPCVVGVASEQYFLKNPSKKINGQLNDDRMRSGSGAVLTGNLAKFEDLWDYQKEGECYGAPIIVTVRIAELA